MIVVGVYVTDKIRQGLDPRIPPAIDVLLGDDDPDDDPVNDMDKLAVDSNLRWRDGAVPADSDEDKAGKSDGTSSDSCTTSPNCPVLTWADIR